MKKLSLQTKLESLVERHEELRNLLSEQEVIADQNRFRALSKEYAQLEPLVECFKTYQSTQGAINAAEKLLEDADPELRKLAEEELVTQRKHLEGLEDQLKILLLPQDPNDERNVYLEIRAGAGGDEAAIFAGDLLRMYTRYAESQNWRLEVVSESTGEHGGYKEVISRILGRNVYYQLKFESGAHRVQRVPATESQGRIHT